MNFNENESRSEILLKYWGFTKFRDSQEEIIDNVIENKDVLALLPTGGGKSLCYQLPAILKKGTCIVISPLIALMEDQVSDLQKKGINATYLNSNHRFKDIDRILDNVIYGDVKFLFISPERINSRIFEERFKKMNINFIAVDEAHCISEWGNDFRPDFRNISYLKKWKPEVSFIALTATATKEVVTDIQSQLLFKEFNVVRKSFIRNNIIYKIIDCSNKEDVLLKTLKKECSIIYVRTRNKSEYLSDLLNKHGFKTNFYHGGLDFEVRTKKQKHWIDNRFNTMVATSAFGMGINKSNVRSVIHYEISDTIESFYQESGRAGRDGKTAYSLVLKNESDLDNIKKRHLIKYPSLDAIKKVFQTISNHHQIAMGYSSEKNYSLDIDLIAQKTNLPRLGTMACLNYLKKEEYIKEINKYEFSQLQIIEPLQNLNIFLKKHTQYEKIIDVLIRSYSNINNQNIAISEQIISKRLNQESKETICQLNRLNELKIVAYNEKKSSYTIQFQKPRPNINTLRLSVNHLHQKDLKEHKIKAIMNFTRSRTTCRNKKLLNYFGEKSIEKCNNCDNCTMGLKKDHNPTNIIENAILILIQYEPKSPNYLFKQFQGLIENETYNKIVKNMIKNERIFLVNNLLCKS